MNMTADKLLFELDKKIEDNKIEDIKIFNIPLWNILKHKLCSIYLVKTGIRERMPQRTYKYSINNFIKSFIESFIDFHRLMFFAPSSKIIFSGFSRHEKAGDFYLDKYIDPLLSLSNIGDDYIYLEYGRNFHHQRDRFPIKNRYYSDYLNLIGLVLGYLLVPIIYLINYKELKLFTTKVTACVGYKITKLFVAKNIGYVLALSYLYNVIIKKTKAKKVIGVSRITFKGLSLAAKRNKLKTFELQHGITLSYTPLYTGRYQECIDPDYFLAFGNSCWDYFGISKDKIINIGWAFNSFIKTIIRNDDNNLNNIRCLMISEGEISDKIIETAIKLSLCYKEIYFDIRRHPQEIYSKQQEEVIDKYEHIKDVTAPISSAEALAHYDLVIGENSSVLFEAVDMGKKVARLNFNGLHVTNKTDNDAFYYINKIEDFKDYLEGPIKIPELKSYSDFNVELFNTLIN